MDCMIERVREFMQTWMEAQTAGKGQVTMSRQQLLQSVNAAYRATEGVGHMYVPYAGKTYVATFSFNEPDQFIWKHGTLANLSVSITFK